MNIKPILILVPIITASFFISCEPVPQNAIDDARTALEKAEKAGGRIWAPTQLKTGRACYDSAMQELALEKKKLPFRRNYKKVIELLDIANEAGYYALQTTQKANERIMSESRELLDRAKKLTDSIDIILKAAAANKKNIRHLQATLDSARMAREEALAELTGGDLLLAEEKAMAASDKTEEVAERTAELLSPQKKRAGK
jgi:hypothetical protein